MITIFLDGDINVNVGDIAYFRPAEYNTDRTFVQLKSGMGFETSGATDEFRLRLRIVLLSAEVPHTIDYPGNEDHT